MIESDTPGRGAEISASETSQSESKGEQKKTEVLNKMARLKQERARLNEAFRKAKAAGKTAEKDRYWQKLLEVQKKISTIREQVRDSNHGELPEWWNE